MKLNIASPRNGFNISIEVTGNTERMLYGKSIGDVVDAGMFNPEYAGWKVQFTGGSDKQGFPMDISLKTEKRQRLLRRKGNIGYKPKKKGERKRKSVRGAVISEETAVLCLKIVNDPFSDGSDTQNIKHIPGLTENQGEITHLPKRLTKLHKAFFPEIQDYKDLTENEIRDLVRKLIEVKPGSKRKMPRLRVTRIRSPHFEERLQKRLDDKQKRKEKSDAIRTEFLSKYPDWKVVE